MGIGVRLKPLILLVLIAFSLTVWLAATALNYFEIQSLLATQTRTDANSWRADFLIQAGAGILLVSCSAFGLFYIITRKIEKSLHNMGRCLFLIQEGEPMAKIAPYSQDLAGFITYGKVLQFISEVAKEARANRALAAASRQSQDEHRTAAATAVDAANTTLLTAPPSAARGQLALTAKHPILESIHEGLVVVDDSLKIGHLYSEQARKLLAEESLAGKDFFKLLSSKSISSESVVNQLRDTFLMAFNLFITDQFSEVMKNAPKILPIHIGEHSYIYEFNYAPYVEDESVKQIVVTFSNETDRAALSDVEGFAASKALDSIVRVHELVRGRWKAQTLLDFTHDNIQTLAQILALIDDEYDADHVFRHLHNLKGAARTLDLSALARVAHSCENYVTKVREGAELDEDATMIFKSQLMSLKDAMVAMKDIVSPYAELAATEAHEWEEKWQSYCDDMRSSMKEISYELGKLIELEVAHTDRMSHLDFRMLKGLLLHIVRNAADHGIETPKERLAKGKPEMGLIRVSVFNEQGEITVKVVDDGRGLNFEALWKKAVERGLEVADWQQWQAYDALQVLCHPGFSSREEVTDISGRGVGMDSVAFNLNEVGGQFVLQDTGDHGTEFLMKWQARSDEESSFTNKIA